MSAEAVEQRSLGIAAAEEKSAALVEQQDVARGLENFPVRVWSLGAETRPKPFQVEAGLGRRGGCLSCGGAAKGLLPFPPSPPPPSSRGWAAESVALPGLTRGRLLFTPVGACALPCMG